MYHWVACGVDEIKHPKFFICVDGRNASFLFIFIISFGLSCLSFGVVCADIENEKKKKKKLL